MLAGRWQGARAGAHKWKKCLDGLKAEADKLAAEDV